MPRPNQHAQNTKCPICNALKLEKSPRCCGFGQGNRVGRGHGQNHAPSSDEDGKFAVNLLWAQTSFKNCQSSKSSILYELKLKNSPRRRLFRQRHQILPQHRQSHALQTSEKRRFRACLVWSQFDGETLQRVSSAICNNFKFKNLLRQLLRMQRHEILPQTRPGHARPAHVGAIISDELVWTQTGWEH